VAETRSDLLAVLAPITKALRRIEDTAAARSGLTMWQYAILSVIDQAPGLNQRTVAARLDYSPNRLILDLDQLEQQQLLTRSPGPDRRANVLTATAEGTRFMRQIRSEIRRREDTLLAPLTPTQRNALVAAASVLTKSLRGSDSVDTRP